MEKQILLALTKNKSIWELFYNMPILFENITWSQILINLILLFRKDTFFNLIGTKSYYPQATPNCRYYIKPNDGSCGKGIKIVNIMPSESIQDHIICPEIMTPLININDKKYKYDYRVWIGIKSDLTYYICPTLIRRISNIPFSLNTDLGSLTNTSLYSDRTYYKDEILYCKINSIVKNVLTNLSPINETQLMLTGWDFIENEYNELFVLEVNPNPSINIQHSQVMIEFLNWVELENIKVIKINVH